MWHRAYWYKFVDVWSSISLPSWRLGQYIPPKRRFISTRLQDATLQKNEAIKITAMWTSNLFLSSYSKLVNMHLKHRVNTVVSCMTETTRSSLWYVIFLQIPSVNFEVMLICLWISQQFLGCSNSRVEVSVRVRLFDVWNETTSFPRNK